eukprot:m.45744 g.45744  ORF g.45744 m.45744 type:complete len:54 (+) comp15141_c0_seq9:2181-2342(+)
MPPHSRTAVLAPNDISEGYQSSVAAPSTVKTATWLLACCPWHLLQAAQQPHNG